VAGDNGLFTFSPWLLLALPGWWLLWRRGQARRPRHRADRRSLRRRRSTCCSSPRINFWRGGWQLGPRYITAMLPFLLPPVAMAMSAAATRWAWRGLVLGLIGVGVVVYAVSAAEFPHFPEAFGDPIWDLVVGLIADGHAGPTALSLVGAHGAWTLLPLAALVLGVVGVALLRGASPRGRLASLAWRW
jgi:hypothetical protein